MTYRPLGDSGLMVSAVGIGCNAFGRRVDLDGVRDILDAAQDVGRHAPRHRRHLRRPGRERGDDRRGARRGAATTSWSPPSSGGTCRAPTAPTTVPAVRAPTYAERSRPRCAGCGSTRSTSTSSTTPTTVTPIEETLSVLTDLVREGKVRYVGVLERRRLAGRRRRLDGPHGGLRAVRLGAEPLLPARPRHRGRRRARRPSSYGLGVLPYFPLEYGLLTGKYRRGATAPAGSRAAAMAAPWLESADWDRIEALEKYAEQRGVPLLDVAIAGLAAQPAVGSVISGATCGDQVRANAAALGGSRRGRPRRARRGHPGLTSRLPGHDSARRRRTPVRRPGATASTAPSRSPRTAARPETRDRSPRRA